jgi:AmmeMemoRadiSam system protein B
MDSLPALPALRTNLDFMPSPDPARPGLLIRDPYHYSDASLLIPPALVQCLANFDGEHTELDLRADLVHATGEIQVGAIEKQLFDALNQAGFLDNTAYREIRLAREAEFAAAPVREAVFAGNAYPDDRAELQGLLDTAIGESQGTDGVIAVAAPHASPEASWQTYRAAYQSLPTRKEAAGRTFVVLGTSHYGAPECFGLTRKSFATPFGSSLPAVDLIDELARRAEDAVRMEDYCHAVEHSIEFQIVFLQHLYGENVSILPILCGPFVSSLFEGGLPEKTERVAKFFDVAGEIFAREAKRLFFVLGVDMAHMGQRYGDQRSLAANEGEMLAVKDRDYERIRQLESADARAYWDLVQQNEDDLKWCGSAPLYTFLRTVPGVSGELLRYHQWQIDPHSVVSFGAMKFRRTSG